MDRRPSHWTGKCAPPNRCPLRWADVITSLAGMGLYSQILFGREGAIVIANLIVVCLALCCCLVGVACQQADAAPSGGPAADHPQGIEGQVVALEGNFMPGPVVPGQRPGGTKKPLSVPVHVFRGKIEVRERPAPKHPALVAVVKSDAKGSFRVPLPPGEYTVVAEIGGKLYLNIFEFDATTRKSVWPTVNVEPKKWSRWVIEDTSNAAF